MSSSIAVDICVIGAGAGGTAVAMAVAAFGVPVALVMDPRAHSDLEEEALAAQGLVAAARRAADIRGAGALGVVASINDIDFARVMARARGVVEAMAPNAAPARLEAMGVRVLRGSARFVDPRTVDAGGQMIRARRFVLATGSRAATPDIPGLSETTHLTGDTVFALTEQPSHLAIIGAGAAGVEWAQAFARLGSRVTLLDARRALGGFDYELARIALRQLARDGVVIRDHATIAMVKAREAGVSVSLNDGVGPDTIEASHLLIAADRRPALDGLDLEKAGVAWNAEGVTVDRYLRASNRRIYAIGGCAAGQPRVAGAAAHHANLVVRSALFRLPARVDVNALPQVLFTDPEIASCGLSEDDARSRRADVKTYRWPFAENDRARADGALEGHVKLVATTRGRLLGAAIVGRGASELIAPWSVAIARGLSLQQMIDVTQPALTRADAGRRAALSHLLPMTQKPGMRRLIAFLRKFG